MVKLFFIILLFVIIGGALVYQNFIQEQAPEIINTETNPFIQVADHKPGRLINVKFASMPRDGYTVIYDEVRENPATILGNSKFLFKGEHQNVPIALVQSVLEGEYLFALLHQDNSDKSFNPSVDVPLKDSEGGILYARFRITRKALEPRITVNASPIVSREGPISSGGCKVAGCSGQLCVDGKEGDIITTCEFRAEYACYRNARCERQSDGKCDWTPTGELISCLRSAEAEK